MLVLSLDTSQVAVDESARARSLLDAAILDAMVTPPAPLSPEEQDHGAVLLARWRREAEGIGLGAIGLTH
jgi:hypothetical protein